MVFSNSISEYFDPPNWPQEGNQQQSGIIPTTDHPLEILASPPAQVSVNGGSGSIRPGSMLDRARLARVPLPEPGLKCPRCDSSNTKFCYFNNYNLSQPRHFCKTCRRYWTRGGALRNVPVGGGYRRNKRSKGRTKSASAQPHPAQRNRGGGGSSSNINTALPSSVNTNTNANANGGFSSQMVLPPPPPYIPGLHHLNEYMGGGFGLNLGGGEAAQFEMGGTSSSGVHQLSNLLNGSTGVTGNGLYPTLTFHQDQSNTSTANELNHDHTSRSGFGSQVSRVKPEDDSHGTNLSKNFMMGIRQANGDHDDDDQYHNWGLGNGWTEISGFQAPSSAGNLF